MPLNHREVDAAVLVHLQAIHDPEGYGIEVVDIARAIFDGFASASSSGDPQELKNYQSVYRSCNRLVRRGEIRRSRWGYSAKLEPDREERR